MRKPDSRSAKSVLPLAVFTALLVWGACSENGVSPPPDGSACASDSLCKSGLRTLAAGQWWEEIQFDTLESRRDSAGGSVVRTVYREHHRHSEVLSAALQNGDWFYRIQTRDTLLRPGNILGDSVSMESLVIRHSDSLIEFSFPNFLNPADTFQFAALKLPPHENGQPWTILSESIDTAMRLRVNPLFSFPARYQLNLQSEGTYGQNRSIDFGGKAYACRSVNRTTDFNAAVQSDTVLVFVDTVAEVGDTIAVSSSHSTQVDWFNFDLTVSFTSREVETKVDSNYIDSTSTRENNIKVKTLTRYSDPRRILSD